MLLPDDAIDRLRDGRSRLFTSQEVMDSLPEAPKDDFFGGSIGAFFEIPVSVSPILEGRQMVYMEVPDEA